MRPETVRDDVSGYCVIDGKTYPAAQITATYALNSIPTATAVLGLGKDAQKGDISLVHAGIADRNADGFLRPASVHLEVRREGVTHRVKIFEGYLTGLGYTHRVGQRSLVAHLSHWLIDTTFSVALVNSRHPLNASTLINRATFIGEGSSAVSKPFFLPRLVTLPIDEAQGDVAQALVLLFRQVCREDILASGSADDCFGGGEGNTIALRAFTRFATEPGAGAGEKTKSRHFSGLVPAAFAEGLSHLGRDALESWIRGQIDETFFTSNLWDKMVSLLAPSLKLAVVPLAESALLVPYIPLLKEYGAILSPDEIASIDLQSFIPYPVRAVGIVAGMAVRSGAIDSGNDFGALMQLGGCFARDPQQKGTVIFVDAPPWLTATHTLAADVNITTKGTAQGMRATPTATTPNERGQAPDAEDLAKQKGPYRRLAESIYYQELLRGRRGMIATDLRWDIAPGSTIMVEATPSTIADDKLQSTPIVTAVERVHLLVDAERPQCGTLLECAFYRTEKENESMTAERHPLYGAAFTGAVLVEEQT